MQTMSVVRPGIAGMFLLAAVCAFPSRGAGAGDGAVLNGIHRSSASTMNLQPDTTRIASLRPVSGMKRADVRKWKVPPVDVRALAASETRASESAPASPRQGSSGAGLPVLLAAVLVAAVSTALILVFVARASGRGNGSPAVPPPPREEAVSSPAEPEGVVYAGEPGGSVPEEEDGYFGVGRGLRGARGEMALAVRLHSGAMGDGSGRSARSACGADATNAERVKVAKRLGIGRGEIDLALRLRKLESTISTEVKTA